MPVEFSDAEDISELGIAGFLRIEEMPGGGAYRGAIFAVNARGEPIEFSYNSVEVPNSFLWRQSDIRRHAVRSIVTSVFQTCQSSPQLLVCLGREIDHEVFCSDIRLAIPICRLVPALETVSHSPSEQVVPLSTDDPLNAFWNPERPIEGSTEGRLFSRLVGAGLLLEPFDRVERGLAEVYGDGNQE